MIRIIAIVILTSIVIVAPAQTTGRVKDKKAEPKVAVTTCPDLIVDLNTGRVNGIKPSVSMSAVKKKLPCFTGESEEGIVANCGGGVFYLKNDIYFYTGRNYIEIRNKFSGRTEPALLGTSRDDVLYTYGEADIKVDGGRVLIYKKPYGSLRLVFNMDGRCIEIGIHSDSPSKVVLCE
jgi:hypothetical protein